MAMPKRSTIMIAPNLVLPLLNTSRVVEANRPTLTLSGDSRTGTPGARSARTAENHMD